MIYSGKEILKKFGTRYNLSKALNNKKIFKLSHGIYSDKDLVSPMIIASKKIPKCYYYYELCLLLL